MLTYIKNNYKSINILFKKNRIIWYNNLKLGGCKMLEEKVDVKENSIINIDFELLSILLKDNTTEKNIIWATDNYKNHGMGYGFKDEIKSELITGYCGMVIKPRTKKSKVEQTMRIKEKAEVFTPSWICNNQNNLI